MSDRNSRGIWGRVATAGAPRSELAAELVQELDAGFEVLADLPPAVTFFGGARVRQDDPFYGDAEEMGELLADKGIPPRTGAGPGIMSAVPEGFRRRADDPTAPEEPLCQRELGQGPQPLTQGFNIILPFEQEVNPAIDLSMELAHFPTRKLMLYQNVLGLVIFPGGFGTLDELLEVWRMKAAGRLDFPVVLFGRDFWKPLEQSLHVAHKAFPNLDLGESLYDLLHCTDDPGEAIELVVDQSARRDVAEPLMDLGHRIARELVEGLDYLEGLSPAVTVLGGTRLKQGSEPLKMAEELAQALGHAGVATRAAGPGNLSVALARGGHHGQRYLPQQAFGMWRPDARNLYGADRVHLVSDRITHKVLLTENSRALVAFPGGLGTLDELFSILCQLQTRTVSNRPIVLMGSEFWQPILDTIRTVMFDGPRQTIGPDDLDLVTVTDDPLEAARLALAPPQELEPKTGRG